MLKKLKKRVNSVGTPNSILTAARVIVRDTRGMKMPKKPLLALGELSKAKRNKMPVQMLIQKRRRMSSLSMRRSMRLRGILGVVRRKI